MVARWRKDSASASALVRCSGSRAHLGSEPLGENFVGQSRDVGLSLLDNDKRESTNVGSDDASSDGLPLPLSRLAGTEARVSLGKQEFDTAGDEDSLLEGETLLL